MPTPSPVRIGIAGLGGYARNISNLILNRGPKIEPQAVLAAACDPALDAHAERAAELRQQGVALFSDYDAMLANADIDAVWLPVPIPLHRPFTEKALAAGKPVMVEKPIAGAIDDVDAIIAARDAAGLPVAVGFQDVYDPTTLPLKRRLRDGVIGRVERVTLSACWPRMDHYFNRAAWAGRQRVGDTWVLDSPANNALAHFVNIVMFLLGPDDESSAAPTGIEAELYRAAPIENYDTISARASLSGGTDLIVLLTHAATEFFNPRIEFKGERGRIVWTVQDVRIESDQGDLTIRREGDMRHHMLERFARLVRGMPDPSIPVATLEVGRAHALFVNGASEATPVLQAPEEAVEERLLKDGTVWAIRGIEDAIRRCAEEGKLLHESGLLPFTQPPGRKDLEGYAHFGGPRDAKAPITPLH